MLLNHYVVTYCLISLASLALILPASAVALSVRRHWRLDSLNSEERGTQENRVYLVISLLWLGFAVRLLMVPLWFLTLQSLIPSVPGAMCLTGLHLQDLPVSYLDSLAKLGIPLVYLYWMILDVLDRCEASQPFFKTKLALLYPLAFLTLIESSMDIHFLRHIQPTVVGCCTSVFDVPEGGPFLWIREHADYFGPAFCASSLIGLSLLWLARVRQQRLPLLCSGLLLIMALASLLLYLQTKVAPVVLEAPFHQCLFCLCQSGFAISGASLTAVSGLWLLITRSLLPDLRPFGAGLHRARQLEWLGVSLTLAGTGLISAVTLFRP